MRRRGDRKTAGPDPASLAAPSCRSAGKCVAAVRPVEAAIRYPCEASGVSNVRNADLPNLDHRGFRGDVRRMANPRIMRRKRQRRSMTLSSAYRRKLSHEVARRHRFRAVGVVGAGPAARGGAGRIAFSRRRPSSRRACRRLRRGSACRRRRVRHRRRARAGCIRG